MNVCVSLCCTGSVSSMPVSSVYVCVSLRLSKQIGPFLGVPLC